VQTGWPIWHACYSINNVFSSSTTGDRNTFVPSAAMTGVHAHNSNTITIWRLYWNGCGFLASDQLLLTAQTTAYNQKSVQIDANTARWLYSKAKPKIFVPPQNPFPGARDGRNLISCRRSLPLPTNPVWWGSMHAVSSYRGNHVSTNKQTNTRRPPATDRTDNNTLRR